MIVIDDGEKECNDILDDLWNEGRDEYGYVVIGGLLNKNNAVQFAEEIEDFINKWNWETVHCTRRIEKYRSDLNE